MATVMPDASDSDLYRRTLPNRDIRSRRCGWTRVGVANSSPHPARALPGRAVFLAGLPDDPVALTSAEDVRRRPCAIATLPWPTIAPEALDCLRAYPWPGNIRELQSVLKQALLHASGTVLLLNFLPDALCHTAAGAVDVASPAADDLGLCAFIRQRLSPRRRGGRVRRGPPRG
jgi:hypothetical protein